MVFVQQPTEQKLLLPVACDWRCLGATALIRCELRGSYDARFLHEHEVLGARMMSRTQQDMADFVRDQDVGALIALRASGPRAIAFNSVRQSPSPPRNGPAVGWQEVRWVRFV